MVDKSNAIDRLINEFTKLPGVGKRTATRYAHKVIEMPSAEALEIADAIKQVKENVKYCTICGNFAENGELCVNCKSGEKPIIVVVKDSRDIAPLKRASSDEYSFHVLHGLISPMDNVGVNDINIKSLLSRISTSVIEVILALSPTVEGDATAMYIARLLTPLGVKVTRLASGLSVGASIEFADEGTLERALISRTIVN